MTNKVNMVEANRLNRRDDVSIGYRFRGSISVPRDNSICLLRLERDGFRDQRRQCDQKRFIGDSRASTLASASEDETVRLWDSASGGGLSVPLSTPGGWAAWSPDGRYEYQGGITGYFWRAINLCRFEPGEPGEWVPDLRTNLDEKFIDFDQSPLDRQLSDKLDVGSNLEPEILSAKGLDLSGSSAYLDGIKKYVEG